MLNQPDPSIYQIKTRSDGPKGKLPLTEEQLLKSPSGDIFGMTQNAGMGWKPEKLNSKQFLLLSTQGGIRAADGTPIALGYHTGHWEIGLLMQTAAEELKALGGLPFAGYCSDPCDGRSQGTPAMMDSLAWRNDAATIFRRLIRSLPTRKGVLGVATCDKGLPAMMIALASMRELPCVIVPGGVTLPPSSGEDAGVVQTLGARFSQGEISLEYAQDVGCRACASPGGGCQFLGTAATSQVVSEAMGLSLTHSALAPSGQQIWLDNARQSARALWHMEANNLTVADILTEASIKNAMAVHAAVGGSTNLLLHIPAIAFAAGLPRPSLEDWIEVNRRVPRIVDVLPNGPKGYPTICTYLAGGVPEVMLKMAHKGRLNLDVMTVTGCTLAESLECWEKSERRKRVRERLYIEEELDPDDVIMDFKQAAERGLRSTVTFPSGNIAPLGSVIKSTAIDPTLLDANGVYRKAGPAKVFTRERAAIAAIKNGDVKPGDVMILICAGPMGSGMEETYQVTSALKYVSWGKHVALITDARFSGVSTGACIGHVGPEALAGGPIGKIIDGDIIEIIIDSIKLQGSINLVGSANDPVAPSREHGDDILSKRKLRQDLSARPDLPADTKLWAALQKVGGGTWGGCVYDTDKIIELIEKGMKVTI
jgi:putative YjhG/YagF family dehydratase